jgi:hypothetical protein
MMRNPIYVGKVESPDYGVSVQGDFDPLVDEATFYRAQAESIDVTTYGRQRDKLREELTLAKIDHHAEAVEELDVEGILACAKRILPRASDLWVQASLDYEQRLQELFFPEGIAYDGNRFNRTAATAPLFNYLAPTEGADERVVSRAGIEHASSRLRGWPQPLAMNRNGKGSPSLHSFAAAFTSFSHTRDVDGIIAGRRVE